MCIVLENYCGQWEFAANLVTGGVLAERNIVMFCNFFIFKHLFSLKEILWLAQLAFYIFSSFYPTPDGSNRVSFFSPIKYS